MTTKAKAKTKATAQGAYYLVTLGGKFKCRTDGCTENREHPDVLTFATVVEAESWALANLPARRGYMIARLLPISYEEQLATLREAYDEAVAAEDAGACDGEDADGDTPADAAFARLIAFVRERPGD